MKIELRRQRAGDATRRLGDAILVPVGGLDKLATFVALLGSNKLKLVVLHDRASIPHQKLDDLVRQKLIERKRVLDFSMFLDPAPTEGDIEDLLPANAYIAAFNAVYAKELNGGMLTGADMGAQPHMIERINHWLKAKDITLLKDGASTTTAWRKPSCRRSRRQRSSPMSWRVSSGCFPRLGRCCECLLRLA